MSALFPTYGRSDLAFERGEGAWLIAADGKRYLDFGSGVAVTVLGHSHPHLVEALTEQAGKLWHVSNLHTIPQQERLAERLCAACFADRAFFCNSGAEAMEASIKLARRYHAVNGAPERYRLITFEGAFHGRTLATIAAGGQAKHLDGFGPPMDGFDQVEAGDIEEVRAAVTPRTAAIAIEPVMGEGGIRLVSPEFLNQLRALCDEQGLLLIFDEVQTGIGRTGKLFAHQWSGVSPDIMAVAKGLGGGFPVGACLAREQVAIAMTPGSHGSTFGGNPLAMAVGNAVLDVLLAPGFLDSVTEKGERLKQRLTEVKQAHPGIVAEIRGLGLMLGLRCVPEISNVTVVKALIKEGLLTVQAGDNVVRLLPPLIIGEAEIDAAIGKLNAALRTIELPQPVEG